MLETCCKQHTDIDLIQKLECKEIKRIKQDKLLLQYLNLQVKHTVAEILVTDGSEGTRQDFQLHQGKKKSIIPL